MAIPLKYNIRSLLNRRVSTALIILGIALVVMIFISMMAMAQSMRRAIVQTGCADNVIIKVIEGQSHLSSKDKVRVK